MLSELDYAYSPARRTLGLGPNAAHGVMLRTGRWKYIAWQGFPPQLFDMDEDPGERIDRGRSPAHAPVREALQAIMFDKLAARRYRTTESDASVEARTANEHLLGVRIGEW